MTTDMRCPTPIGFADIVDYWAGELTGSDEDKIEAHVFGCAECARELAAAEALTRGVAAVAREGRLHTVVTDAILNRLAADGLRIRTFTLEGDSVVPCAVWAGDDLVVARIRGDFTGVDAVTIVTRLASGDEIPIEERDPAEVTEVAGVAASGRVESVRLVPDGTAAANWAFDVTPAELVTGLITERGICAANEESILALFPEHASSARGLTGTDV